MNDDTKRLSELIDFVSTYDDNVAIGLDIVFPAEETPSPIRDYYCALFDGDGISPDAFIEGRFPTPFSEIYTTMNDYAFALSILYKIISRYNACDDGRIWVADSMGIPYFHYEWAKVKLESFWFLLEHWLDWLDIEGPEVARPFIEALMDYNDVMLDILEHTQPYANWDFDAREHMEMESIGWMEG